VLDLLVEAGDCRRSRNWSGSAAPPLMRRWLKRACGRRLATPSSVYCSRTIHIRGLNAQWRTKDKATNVLSFPAFAPNKTGPLPPMLGDIVLAAETVKREAVAEEKPLDHHISHLVVHGLLHLIGYDHEVDEDAEEMEALERRVLARLAIPDPYA
jgi:probable rRNA maturation factor